MVAVKEGFGVHRAPTGGHEAVDDEEGAVGAEEGEGVLGSERGVGWRFDMGGENDAIDAKESVAGAGEASKGEDFAIEAGGGLFLWAEGGEGFVELCAKGGAGIVLGNGGWKRGIIFAKPAGAGGGEGGVDYGLV